MAVGCIFDGNNRWPRITLCSGRWLNMTDSVNTDHSNGTKLERWWNGNMTHSVNRPLWKHFIGQVEKKGESVTGPAQWNMQWMMISFILTLKNVFHFAVNSFYLWNELYQHKLWQPLQANIRTCKSSTSFCFRGSCKLNH